MSTLPKHRRRTRTSVSLTLRCTLTLGYRRIRIVTNIIPTNRSTRQCQTMFVSGLHCTTSHFTLRNGQVLIRTLDPNIGPRCLFSDRCRTLTVIRRITQSGIFVRLSAFRTRGMSNGLARLVHSCTKGCTRMRVTKLPSQRRPSSKRVGCP